MRIIIWMKPASFSRVFISLQILGWAPLTENHDEEWYPYRALFVYRKITENSSTDIP